MEKVVALIGSEIYLKYTELAVKRFQAYYGISPTGKVGNKTLRVMKTVIIIK